MNDDVLLAEIRDILNRVDGSVESSRELAYAALGWQDLDTELAELIFDSALDHTETLVRGAEENRLLTFQTAEVSIEVELSGTGLVGQVIPPTAMAIEFLRPSGTVQASTESDELGVFTLDDLPDGPASLTLTALDGSWSVRTAWTST